MCVSLASLFILAHLSHCHLKDSEPQLIIQTTTIQTVSTTGSVLSLDAYALEDWESGDEKRYPWYFGGQIAPEIVKHDPKNDPSVDGSSYCLRFGQVQNKDEYSQFGFSIHVSKESWVSFNYKMHTVDSDFYLVLYTGESYTSKWIVEEGVSLGHWVYTAEEKFYQYGFTKWEKTQITLSPGVYDIAWRFENTGGSHEQNTTNVAWIDNIQFGPDVEPIDPQPFLAANFRVRDKEADGTEEITLMLMNGDTLNFDLFPGTIDGWTGPPYDNSTMKVADGEIAEVSLFGIKSDLPFEGPFEVDYRCEQENIPKTEFLFTVVVNGPITDYILLCIFKLAPGDRRKAAVKIPYNSYKGDPLTFFIEWNPNW